MRAGARGIIAACALAAAAVAGLRAQAPVLPLWPEGVPNAQRAGGLERIDDGRVSNVHVPTLTYVAPAATPTGMAVIVCPGGGYARLAMSNEPAGITDRLSREGIATFVLKYRLKEYGFPAPLQDVLRAVRLVRSRAGEFGCSTRPTGARGPRSMR